ncbi:MAG: hypothetical protein M1541_02010, partial [Acidobacteria bacterium]|nr:hypothetical protein [Acidobacteriota bacterium]
CNTGLLTLALAACPLWAGEAAPAREGPYWCRDFSGTSRVASDRLQVRSGWNITVSGGAGDEIAWSCKVRIKALGPQEAARHLAGFAPVFSRQGPYTVMAISPDLYVADLNLTVPRHLREVVIASVRGGINASGVDGAVSARTGGGAVKLDRIGSNVHIETAGGAITLGAIGGDAHCLTAGGPITADVIRGAALFQTGGGDIVVREIGGLLRASTDGGLIRVGRAGSAVIASTAGGSIEVAQARGAVTARSSAGPINVGGAAGVECQSAAGAIRLSNVSRSLRAYTAMGSIVAQLMADRPFADSFLVTRDGDITVLIPSNLGVRIRAENQSPESLRKIISEFPGISVQFEDGLAVAEGVLNGGGPLLRISGNGGVISIKRQN